MRHTAAENRRAHNERGGFRFGACSATAGNSPLFRRADEPEALAATPDTRIDAGAERRVALVRRVDPTPTSENTRRPNCHPLRVGLRLFRLRVPAKEFEVSSTCVFASIYTPLPNVAVHIIKTPGVWQETSDLDVMLCQPAAFSKFAKLVHIYPFDVEIPLRPCSAGVFPLNLGRQVEINADSLAQLPEV